MAASRSRTWCLTLNNYTDEELLALQAWCVDHTVYHILGREVGESGTKHIQGYIRRKSACTLSVLKKTNERAHWEVAKGTDAQNQKYCSKENDYIEGGELPTGQGARTDQRRVWDSIKEGEGLIDILEEHGDKALRMFNVVKSVKSMVTCKPRNWVMDVRIYWGESGAGKSRAVWDEFGVDNVYPKMPGKWWDHYEGQDVVLIDDFDPGDRFGMTFDFYLKLLDRYPMFVEFKGGSCHFCSKVIIITSNFDPETWWLTQGNRDAFFRRVGVIHNYTEVREGNTVPPAVTAMDSGLTPPAISSAPQIEPIPRSEMRR